MYMRVLQKKGELTKKTPKSKKFNFFFLSSRTKRLHQHGAANKAIFIKSAWATDYRFFSIPLPSPPFIFSLYLGSFLKTFGRHKKRRFNFNSIFNPIFSPIFNPISIQIPIRFAIQVHSVFVLNIKIQKIKNYTVVTKTRRSFELKKKQLQFVI